MTHAVRTVVGRAGSALLTVSAVLGTVCLLSTLVAPMVGVRPLIFTSGSMAPAIPAGSLALAKVTDADDLEVGDVVTVPLRGSFVTHRIVSVTHAPGKATLILRGDGNKTVDADAYAVTSVPRTFVSIPVLGSVVAWFTHPPGIYVLAGWVALVLGLVRRPRDAGSTGATGAGVGRPKLVLVLGRLLTRPA